jgi:hypothetical protein
VNPAAVEGSDVDTVPTMRLYSREEFICKVFLPAVSAHSTVVTFDAPFDLSRIAARYTLARGDRFRGGFSFPLTT